MATNKNALIRYKVLDNCFRNPGKRYFIDDLIFECERILLEIDPDSKGISRRQLFEDISFMESKEGWGIELEKIRDGKKVYYRYKDMSFSINNMPLSEIELHQLKSAFDLLTHFTGMPHFDWINELLPKLKQSISFENSSTTIIGFDNNPYLKGIEQLKVIYNALIYNKVLLINYKPFESEDATLIQLHPYFLKQYSNRWFLFGYNPEKKKYDWNLAVDRIISIKEQNKPFHKNNEIQWEEYFEDIVGVTKPEGELPIHVVLQFYGKTGKYMETKPLHGSQKSKWINQNTLEVCLEVILNYELERLIVSYADSVKVIQPSILAQKIKQRHENAAILY